MTASKQIYRGYDIEQTDDGWIVSKDGQRRAKAQSEQSALDFVDIEKRKLAQAKATA